MLEAVEESSRRLADRMKIHGYGELTRGVRCPRVSCDAPFIHPGIILPQSNMAECTKRESYRFELSPEQKHWIKSSSHKYCVFLYNYTELMLSVSLITVSVIIIIIIIVIHIIYYRCFP